MAEYIEREAVVNQLLKVCVIDGIYGMGIQAGIRSALLAVKEAKAADVAPVRHGRWIEPPRLYYGAKQYECSLCYSDTFWNKHSITEKYPHCPNCGAKMDLEG